MQKKEFLQLYKKKAGFENDKKAKEALDAFIESVCEVLGSDESIMITNFGTFYTKHAKGRRYRVPGTNRKVMVEGKKQPKFRPSERLKNIAKKL